MGLFGFGKKEKDKMKDGLEKTRTGFWGNILNTLTGSKIDDDLYDELEEQLILADVGGEVAIKLVDKLRDRVNEKGLKTGEQAADELREKYPERKILTIDSLGASLGEGLYVYLAAKKQQSGATIEETYDYLMQTRPHLCHWFTVNDLMHLKRGGRVSATAALLGTMLQIKPVMHMDDEGHLIPVSKARGRKASLQALVQQMAETAVEPEEQTVFICHGDCIDDAEYTASLIREKTGAKTVIINYVGPVIGAHRGLPSAELFTRLDELEKGDRFFLHILDKTLAYKVDQVRVIKPEELEQLQTYHDKDYVTLLTCTPYGVNTHRLLVRGERIPYEVAEENGGEAFDDEKNQGMPQWVKEYVVMIIAGILLLVFAGRMFAARK